MKWNSGQFEQKKLEIWMLHVNRDISRNILSSGNSGQNGWRPWKHGVFKAAGVAMTTFCNAFHEPHYSQNDCRHARMSDPPIRATAAASLVRWSLNPEPTDFVKVSWLFSFAAERRRGGFRVKQDVIMKWKRSRKRAYGHEYTVTRRLKTEKRAFLWYEREALCLEGVRTYGVRASLWLP